MSLKLIVFEIHAFIQSIEQKDDKACSDFTMHVDEYLLGSTATALLCYINLQNEIRIFCLYNL